MAGPAGAAGGADALLQAVAFTTVRFLEARAFEDVLPEVLAALGRAARVSRVYLFETRREDGEYVFDQRFEWVAPGITPQIDNPDLQGVRASQIGFSSYAERMCRGEPLQWVVAHIPERGFREILAVQDIRSLVLVPVMVEGEWWGFLGFDDCWQERGFSPAEVNVLQTAAAALGGALARRRTEVEVARREAILEAVATAAQRFLTAATWEEAAGDVLARLGQAAEASRAYLFEHHRLPDGRPARSMRLEWVAEGVEPVRDRPEHQAVPHEESDMGPFLDLLSRGEVVQSLTAALPEPIRGHLEREGVRAGLAVPVFVGEEWWGYLGFDDCRRERLWPPAAVDALRAAAGILGAAIQRQRAEAERQEAEERYRRLVERIPAVVYEAEFGAEGRWHYVSPRIEELLGFSARDWLADPGLWLRRIHPEDRDRVLADEARAAGERSFSSEYRLLTKDGRVVWVRDEAEVVSDEAGRNVFMRGLLFDVTALKEAERRLRESEATVRRLLARLVRAQEEERARVAQDIHDDSIQIMTAAAVRIQAARRRLGANPEAEALERVEGTVNEAIRRLRRLLFDLRPSALDREGLAAALRLRLERLREEADVAWALDDRTVEEPSPEVRTVLYRIAHEALTNVQKHARASRVEVALEERDRGILLRVRDDGVGFRPIDHAQVPDRLGLTSMRERAEMAGGWLRVESAEGRGTVVEAWVPATPASGPG